MSVSDRLTEFVQALRAKGIQAGPGETVDAAAALEILGFDDREQTREGLAACLIRRDGQRAVFDSTFDLFFPLGVGIPEQARHEQLTLDELNDRLVAALAVDDEEQLLQLAGLAVDAFGQYGQGGSGTSGYSAHQTLDRVQPQTLLVRILAAMQAQAGFTERLDRDEVRRRIERFRELVRGEALRRVAELRGRERLARTAVPPTPDQLDFLQAGRTQVAEMRRMVQPLARKLATRLAARRRRAARGQIDLRRTLRRSLSTGGVPMTPVFRRHRPGRPEIVLLCDMSGSVASFANFTMLLVQALRDQFSKVRVFAFVDGMDEVTHLVTAGVADPAALGARILSEASVIRWDGHSDYGRSIDEFADRYPDVIGPKTSVLILGDARNNNGDPRLAVLAHILRPARRAFWLNPERRDLWNTGDSAAHDYATVIEMHECRNARQLGALVSRLIPV
ncbi:vWA domain-containing protein [Kutzneria sp. CA-103260]|uniref:vWA domain-containing protein n=1 Tax=Kutzneria sp. CA-103260 TaxID=2802641 RepID=UPI001BA8F6E5|nr:VWA domain-containing protein [Kutzneria sp. CA-103260]QUQ62921.1 VWA domain containing CoxE-like protein [Kutzneria sp. CA-103260]